MEKIEKYIYLGIGIFIIILSISLYAALKYNANIEKKWKDAVENVKSYSEQFNNSSSKNRALKLTVEQLEYSSDSILQELNKAREELKIKDSNLKNLQYIKSEFIKTDTIILQDTIFRDPQMEIDTLITDDWYSIKMGLKYPSTISVTPSFKSIKYIIVSSKKETVNPPKKFFLFRWFQKKHTVLNIDVIEKNPYIKTENNRYIEMIE